MSGYSSQVKNLIEKTAVRTSGRRFFLLFTQIQIYENVCFHKKIKHFDTYFVKSYNIERGKQSAKGACKKRRYADEQRIDPGE